MKGQSWLRKNWLLVAGGAFVTIHFATWLLQRGVKSAVRSENSMTNSHINYREIALRDGTTDKSD